MNSNSSPRTTSPGDVVDTSAVGASDSEDTVDKKFSGLPDAYWLKKGEMFHHQLIADKFCTLKSRNYGGRLSDQDLLYNAQSLSEIEEQTLQQQIAEEMQRVKVASKDAVEFKRYFFEELGPIIQENHEGLYIAQKFTKEQRQAAEQVTKDKWAHTKTLTVKLLLSSIPNDNKMGQAVAGLFANVLTQWGLNHAALQVGPYIVDWTTSELVIPRVFKAKKVVLVIPINPQYPPKTEEALTKISEYIVNWNRNFKYDSRTFTFEKSQLKMRGNCHCFVEGLLKVLGVTPSWQPNGPIVRYVRKIKTDIIKGDVLRIWDLNGVEYQFHSHNELVKFYETHVKTISDTEPATAPIRYEMEQILKSLERCMMFRFWATNDTTYRVERPLFDSEFRRKHQKLLETLNSRNKQTPADDVLDQIDDAGEEFYQSDEENGTGNLIMEFRR